MSLTLPQLATQCVKAVLCMSVKLPIRPTSFCLGPRSVTVCEVSVGARPLKVFETIFKDDSPYRLKMVAKEVDEGEGSIEEAHPNLDAYLQAHAW